MFSTARSAFSAFVLSTATNRPHSGTAWTCADMRSTASASSQYRMISRSTPAMA